MQQFEYYRRSAGLFTAISLSAKRLLRPIWFTDEFQVSIRRIGRSLHPDTPSIDPDITGTVITTPGEYDALAHRLHPYIASRGLRDYLGGGSGRYVILTEFAPAGARPLVDFRAGELGRFFIYEYGFGGELPDNYAMTQDAGIAPEFRGQRIHTRSRTIGHEYLRSIGVDSSISVIRTHNVASLRQGRRSLVGTSRDEYGPFKVTSWLGGRVLRLPDWPALRDRLLAGEVSGAGHGQP